MIPGELKVRREVRVHGLHANTLLSEESAAGLLDFDWSTKRDVILAAEGLVVLRIYSLILNKIDNYGDRLQGV